jgi:hypothetical protein
MMGVAGFSKRKAMRLPGDSQDRRDSFRFFMTPA